MNCEEFSRLLDACMDGALPDETAAEMRAHAAACASCAGLLQLRTACRQADEETEVPASFSAAWRQRIQEEETMENNRAKKNWRGWLAAAAALVFVVGGTLITREPHTGQSANSAVAYETNGAAVTSLGRSYAPQFATAYDMDDDMDIVEDYEMAMKTEEAELDAGAEEDAREEKIIRTASFTIRTTVFDKDLQALQDLTAGMGGRIEYLSVSGDAAGGQTRSASLTLRVPAARLDDFLEGAQAIGSVTAMTQEMEDVSDSYYDIQTRLDTQKKKLERLQALMAEADQVSDLIEIESAIADAQYSIDRYTSQLKGYDGKVDYSTVRVTLREIRVEEAEDISLGQRMVSGLKSSLEEGWLFLQDVCISSCRRCPGSW